MVVGQMTLASTAIAEKVKIKLAHLPHLTGGYAAGQAGINDAFLDTVKYANDNNMIPGVELITTWADGGTDTSKSMAGFKKMIAETPRPVVILGESTPIGIALKSWHYKEMVPDLEGGSSVDFFKLPSATFSQPAPYVHQAGAFIDYFMAKIWKKKTKPKFAWLTWDHPAGRSPITPEVEAYIKSKGVEIVGAEFIPLTPTDMTPQLLRLKRKKVDVVYGCAYHNAYAVVLKDMKKLGLLGKFTIGFMYWISPISLIDAVGPLTEGIWQTGIFYTDKKDWKAKAPRYLEIYNKNNRKSDHNIYISGVWRTCTAVEAVKIAVKNVGAKNVDGKAMYDALTQMKNFDGWGIGPPQSFSKTRRYGQDKVMMYRYTNQKHKFIEYYPTPELFPGGKDVPK